jgi:prophage maintenance system killer protein
MLAMVSFLVNAGYRFAATPDNLCNFIINISTGAIASDEIAEWLKENTGKFRCDYFYYTCQEIFSN